MLKTQDAIIKAALIAMAAIFIYKKMNPCECPTVASLPQ